MDDASLIDLFKAGLASVAPDRKADFANVDLSTAINTLGLDSLNRMELVQYVEDELSITFPDEDLATLATLGDLATLVRREQG